MIFSLYFKLNQSGLFTSVKNYILCFDVQCYSIYIYISFFIIVYLLLLYLNRQAKHAHNTIHRFVLPSNCATAVCGIVPEARAGRMQTCTILLHNDASYDIFEGFSKLGQLVQAWFDNTRRPRVDFVLLIRIVTNGALNGLLDNVAHLVDNERSFLSGIIHFGWFFIN